jgi:ABC-type Fe3+-hydroxamate transport system substrate-binding protein
VTSFREVTDQMQRRVAVPDFPQRIISLVPSQTELLFDLGLASRIVGVTKFCIHPAEAKKTKTIIGGTKNFRFDVINRLQPDFIVGNKEENYLEGIEELSSQYPVWMSDITSLEDAFAMMTSVGDLTQTAELVLEMINYIRQQLSTVRLFPKRVLYVIWQNPLMVVGSDTFIDSMLKQVGLVNVVKNSRYPTLSIADLPDLNPEVVFLSSEPFPFRDDHVEEWKGYLPTSKILLVDGELFSWYGSRMRYATGYFQSLAPQL